MNTYGSNHGYKPGDWITMTLGNKQLTYIIRKITASQIVTRKVRWYDYIIRWLKQAINWFKR